MTKKRTASKKRTNSITPYLTVRGASSAIEFYKAAFGAKEIVRSNVPETELVQHAELKMFGASIYLCDDFPEAGILSPLAIGASATMLDLRVDNPVEIWTNALNAGAIEVATLSEMPGGDWSGKLIDPFGHYWSVSGKVVQAEIETSQDIVVLEQCVSEQAHSAAV